MWGRWLSGRRPFLVPEPWEAGLPAVLALFGVIFLVLAGFGVRGPRFAPEWLGVALVALAVFWAPITAIGR